MEAIRLFIVEDQPVILKSQVKLLKQFKDINLIDTALSGEEALTKLEKIDKKPHVILCDLGLPQMSGIDVVKEIKKLYPAIDILIFTVFEEEEKVLAAVKAGAAGYLLKGASAHKIHESIVEVFYGGAVIQPSLAKKLLNIFKAPLKGIPKENLEPTFSNNHRLTPREIECLQMIAKGLNNAEAAQVLSLSRATIRTHLEHVYQKLDVSNRVEAITEGLRQGIIEL